MIPLMQWLNDSWAAHLVNDHRWSWPIAESIHFFGLVLLTGTVGAFDLRLLGLARGVRPADLHRLLRFGILGFVMLLVTGLLFISGAPDQYFYNSAFHLKAISLALMGINVIAFYSLEFRSIQALGPDDEAPRRAKLMAGFSLVLLVAIMLFGRMLTFFRPVF
ncbi:MAG: hypothetical protein PVH89_04700 [Gammaproteobacteria bacterium]|jgi:hypothetical protein